MEIASHGLDLHGVDLLVLAGVSQPLFPGVYLNLTAVAPFESRGREANVFKRRQTTFCAHEGL